MGPQYRPLVLITDEDQRRTALRVIADLGAEGVWDRPIVTEVEPLGLFWPAEEEFPARVRVLFDATADRFLDAECLIFLVEGLVKNVEQQLS